jgi:beta-phosphoglucomutase family hydrolase
MAMVDSPLPPGLALIFDMDGVIIDSNPLHREAWAAFNRRYGLETTPEMHEAMYGRRNDQIVRGFFGNELTDDEVRARGAAKEALYREMMGNRLEQMLVPGIRPFLERNAPAPLALATNAEPENVTYLLDHARLRGCFRAVITGAEVHHPKPHPEIYRCAADLLGVPAANCIVFEDSFTGIAAARAAGMRVVGLCTTHDNLSDCNITIDNFLNGDLNAWLASQTATA